jgi:hypothetical protein
MYCNAPQSVSDQMWKGPSTRAASGLKSNSTKHVKVIGCAELPVRPIQSPEVEKCETSDTGLHRRFGGDRAGSTSPNSNPTITAYGYALQLYKESQHDCTSMACRWCLASSPEASRAPIHHASRRFRCQRCQRCQVLRCPCVRVGACRHPQSVLRVVHELLDEVLCGLSLQSDTLLSPLGCLLGCLLRLQKP